MTARMQLSIDASDFAKAAQALERAGFDRATGRPISAAIRKSINLVRKNVRAQLKPHNKTGKMRDRVRVRFSGIGMDLVGGMRSTGAGSNLIVGGVRPHEITAGGKVMPMWAGKGAWKRGAGAGITGFATVVQHRGFPADPFVRRGIDKSAAAINDILDEAAATMVRDLAYRLRGRA